MRGTLAGCMTTDMLVDYRASTSVMSRSVLDEIERNTEAYVPRKDTNMNIKGYGGHDIPSDGTVILKVKIGTRTFSTPFTVVPYEAATKAVLGASLLVQAKIGITWDNNNAYLTLGSEGGEKLIQAQLAENRAHQLSLINEITLAPKQVCVVEVKHPLFTGKIKNFHHKPDLITTRDGFDGILHIDEVTQSAHKAKQKIRVSNVQDYGITLPSQTPIATIELLHSVTTKAQSKLC